MPISAGLYSRMVHGESVFRWWAPLGLLAIALMAGGARWISTSRVRELRSAEALLSEAYTKERKFELRLPAASHAPLATSRHDDNSALSRPIALLEAESRIAQQLAKSPDDAQWLRL